MVMSSVVYIVIGGSLLGANMSLMIIVPFLQEGQRNISDPMIRDGYTAIPTILNVDHHPGEQNQL